MRGDAWYWKRTELLWLVASEMLQNSIMYLHLCPVMEETWVDSKDNVIGSVSSLKTNSSWLNYPRLRFGRHFKTHCQYSSFCPPGSPKQIYAIFNIIKVIQQITLIKYFPVLRIKSGTYDCVRRSTDGRRYYLRILLFIAIRGEWTSFDGQSYSPAFGLLHVSEQHGPPQLRHVHHKVLWRPLIFYFLFQKHVQIH